MAGLFRVHSRLSRTLFGTWGLFGTWSLELGAWNLELGTWNLELGTWNLELGTWNFPPALCLLQRYSALFSVVQR